MPGWQRTVRVDEVDPLTTMKFPHPPHDVGEQERSRCGKSESSRQGEIPKPLRRRRRSARAKPGTVKRLNRKYRVPHPGFREPIQWFRDEAPAGGIPVVRIKRCERQDVRTASLLRARTISGKTRHLPRFEICTRALPFPLSHDFSEVRMTSVILCDHAGSRNPRAAGLSCSTDFQISLLPPLADQIPVKIRHVIACRFSHALP